MENLITQLGQEQIAVIRTVDCNNANRTKVIIEDAVGNEMFVLLFLNDGSEYCFSEKGTNKFLKILK